MRDQRAGHFRDVRRGLEILVEAGRAGERPASASCTSRPTKFTARWGRPGLFTETTSYDPSSPYSASKASADHLVRAYHRTYGLPVLVTNCSNNYGPYQFPEKLIPLMILNAAEGKKLPVYGDGMNVRDWLFVEDHCRALSLRAGQGQVGRDLQHRRQLRAAEHRDRPPRLRRWSTNCGPGLPQAPCSSLVTLRQGPARPRPPVCHRRRQDPSRAWAGSRSTISHRACGGRSNGISTIPAGSSACKVGSIEGSGWGWGKDRLGRGAKRVH